MRRIFASIAVSGGQAPYMNRMRKDSTVESVVNAVPEGIGTSELQAGSEIRYRDRSASGVSAQAPDGVRTARTFEHGLQKATKDSQVAVFVELFEWLRAHAHFPECNGAGLFPAAPRP